VHTVAAVPPRYWQNRLVAAALAAAAAAGALAPVAGAEDENVTYEVVSEDVEALDIEYFDGSARQLLQDVPLPWRTTVTMPSPRSLGTDGADVRADWRSSIAGRVTWQTEKWVTVRVYIGDTLRCQNTLDVGNAACYGSTSFKS
jgi:hypothetical protein